MKSYQNKTPYIIQTKKANTCILNAILVQNYCKMTREFKTILV